MCTRKTDCHTFIMVLNLYIKNTPRIDIKLFNSFWNQISPAFCVCSTVQKYYSALSINLQYKVAYCTCHVQYVLWRCSGSDRQGAKCCISKWPAVFWRGSFPDTASKRATNFVIRSSFHSYWEEGKTCTVSWSLREGGWLGKPWEQLFPQPMKIK